MDMVKTMEYQEGSVDRVASKYFSLSRLCETTTLCLRLEGVAVKEVFEVVSGCGSGLGTAELNLKQTPEVALASARACLERSRQLHHARDPS